MIAKGRYFPSSSARFVEAQAWLEDGGALRIEDRTGELLTTAPLRQVQASARLGTMPRKLYLPEGGCFETPDNDAIDRILLDSGHSRTAGLLHRLEMSWRMVGISVAAATGVVAFMAFVGLPWMARELANETPPSISRIVSDQTYLALEKLGALKPTKLPPARVKALEARLARVTAAMPPAPDGYRLLLRNTPALGPNAFALPDGRIVMTDQIVTMAKNDDELEGVLAHEASHVIRAHGLQRAYQASLVPAIIAFISGDVSQLSQVVTILPGILLQSSYSKSFEQEADDDAKLAMRKVGTDPARMGDLLVRIEQKYCGKDGCGANWLGTHPDTRLRAERLRQN